MASGLIESILAFENAVRTYIQSELDAVLTSKGLDGRDLIILECLEAMGAVPFAELPSRLRHGNCKGLSKARLSNAASKLYRKGLLNKCPSPENQRQLVLKLEPKGRQLLAAISQLRMRICMMAESAVGLDKNLAEQLSTSFRNGTTKFEKSVRDVTI